MEELNATVRREAWRHVKILSFGKKEYASKLGEVEGEGKGEGKGGTDLVNELIMMLKDIQYNLGVAEFELQIPGAVLDKDFQERVQDVVKRVRSFMDRAKQLDEKDDINTKKREERGNVGDILKDLKPLSNWVKDGRPLVTENHLSEGSSSSKNREQLVEMLIGSNEDVRLLVIPITFTEIDKSTLASHVYHDRRVFHHFNIRHWVRMSEPHGRRNKLLDEVFRGQTSDQETVNTYQKLVKNKRYLLILDGVTQAFPGKFLHDLLKSVGQRSKILLTTSNMDTLRTVAPLQLVHDPFVSERFQNLPPVIQQCLNYCSLFPTKYKYDKADLIHLWIAQDLFIEQGGPESTDLKVGEKYFSSILDERYLLEYEERYLLEDDESDGKGARVWYEMPDVYNEFIKDVAKNEFRLVHSPAEDIDCNSILHLSFTDVNPSWEAPPWLHNAKQLLSLLMLPNDPFHLAPISSVVDILSSLKRLQALDLAAVNCKDVPDSIGELRNLKYLRLGRSLESLPECILKLQELQTLDLRPSNVTELPSDFCNLIGLRHLYSGERLEDMPPNFGELKSLQTLDEFIVGPNNGLAALANLDGLCGKLKIHYKKHYENDDLGVLKGKELTGLSFKWSSMLEEPVVDRFDFLALPSSLNSLEVNHCKGVVFPPSTIDEFSSLVSVEIKDCSRCNRLPDFSILPFLKSLCLWNLDDLEYIENADENKRVSSATDYYPSLERLTLAVLPKLERWSYVNHPKTFPSLAVIKISRCPKMMSMPGAPGRVSLEVQSINKDLLKNLLDDPILPSSSSTSSANRIELKVLHITSVPQIDSLKINQYTLESLQIRSCPKLSSLDLESLTHLRELDIHECGISMTITGCVLKHLSVDFKKGIIEGRIHRGT